MRQFSASYLLIKRILDLVGAITGLLILALVFIPVAIAIKLNSKGPVFFHQERLTLGERSFLFYKFRTMTVGHDLTKEERDNINEMGGPLFKSRLDPRITSVGRILRKFSMDELPQFFNVLKGDMSLVGPRPPLKHEVREYEPWQKRRLLAKAGMTGPWQVSGRSNLDFMHMMRLDIDYIENPSIIRDMSIIIKTIPSVIFCKGAW